MEQFFKVLCHRRYRRKKTLPCLMFVGAEHRPKFSSPSPAIIACIEATEAVASVKKIK